MGIDRVGGGAGGRDDEKASLIPKPSGSFGSRTVIHKHECPSSVSIMRVAGGIVFVASTCAGLGTGAYLIIKGGNAFKIICEIMAIAIPVIIIDKVGVAMMRIRDNHPPAVESSKV